MHLAELRVPHGIVAATQARAFSDFLALRSTITLGEHAEVCSFGIFLEVLGVAWMKFCRRPPSWSAWHLSPIPLKKDVN
jgi:hypothetical protein